MNTLTQPIKLASDTDRAFSTFFSDGRKSKTILVTGPQCSGTTIATQIISKELDRKLYLEEDFSVHNEDQLVDLITLIKIPSVIQCPSMSHIIQDLSKIGCFIVWMKRPFHDIHASEKKIGWKVHEHIEKAKYTQKFPLKTNLFENMRSAEMKQNMWDTYQKQTLDGGFFELDFRMLRRHPMWVNNRAEFKSRQSSTEGSWLWNPA